MKFGKGKSDPERMTWVPGQPVVTAQDEAEWQSWKRSQKLKSQRWRRERYRRIDYYPSEEAQAVIDGLTGSHAGGTYSDVIDALVLAASEMLPE